MSAVRVLGPVVAIAGLVIAMYAGLVYLILARPDVLRVLAPLAFVLLYGVALYALLIYLMLFHVAEPGTIAKVAGVEVIVPGRRAEE